MKLSIEFSNENIAFDSLVLNWNIDNTSPARKWAKFLKKVLQSELEFETRYSGFVNGPRSYEVLSQKLNKCIDIINADGRYYIKEKSPKVFNQEFSNIIHHHFEVLIGFRY